MERFAQAIKLALKIREESYDHIAAYQETIVAQTQTDRSIRKYGFTPIIFIDYSKFYKLTYLQAADKACEIVGFDQRATFPVYLLLTNCLNDSTLWADQVLQQTSFHYK